MIQCVIWISMTTWKSDALILKWCLNFRKLFRSILFIMYSFRHSTMQWCPTRLTWNLLRSFNDGNCYVPLTIENVWRNLGFLWVIHWSNICHATRRLESTEIIHSFDMTCVWYQWTIKQIDIDDFLTPHYNPPSIYDSRSSFRQKNTVQL